MDPSRTEVSSPGKHVEIEEKIELIPHMELQGACTFA
jgi:hypothetical protein